MQTKVIFEKGSLEALRNIKGTKAFIVTDKVLAELGYLDRISDYLKQAGMQVATFVDVKPDPDTKVLADGLKVFRSFEPDVLVAMGGGSAIDAAKGIFYSAANISTKEFTKPYFVAIPSTSGTGSEVTDFAVITAEGEKIVLVDDYLAADLAILDVDLVSSVPKGVTIDTGLDVLAHITEAYVATNASDFSDALAEKAIKLLFANLPKVLVNPQDETARMHVHHASCLAGMAFNQAGLGIVHSLSHAIGGAFHLPHGRCNALLIEKVIEYNAELKGSANNLAAQRYAQLAETLHLSARTTREGVVNYIDAIKKLKQQCQIERGFHELAIDEMAYKQAVPQMVQAALNDRCTPTNPKEPTAAELQAIYLDVY